MRTIIEGNGPMYDNEREDGVLARLYRTLGGGKRHDWLIFLLVLSLSY